MLFSVCCGAGGIEAAARQERKMAMESIRCFAAAVHHAGQILFSVFPALTALALAFGDLADDGMRTLAQPASTEHRPHPPFAVIARSDSGQMWSHADPVQATTFARRRCCRFIYVPREIERAPDIASPVSAVSTCPAVGWRWSRRWHG